MKITAADYASLKADIAAVAAYHRVDVATADGGKTGLKLMWGLFNVVCQNRAYDDKHPGFAGGHWPRILDFDGRDYCWLYKAGLNDVHVATALKNIKSELSNQAR